MTTLSRRHDFVLIFDVANGNPNGDPDAGNEPRRDPETNHGLVSDVCLKRKIRNYVDLLDLTGSRIFVREKEPLNKKIAEACVANELPTFEKEKGGWDREKAKKRSMDDIRTLHSWMCSNFFDVRTFGAVLSTGPNAGQVRGPVQMTFAESVEQISPSTITITRVTDVDKEEVEIGRKHIVPYGLYVAHGFVSAKFAERTRFSEADLDLLFEALKTMFEHDRSAARGEMTTRRLVAFRHESALGNAPAHQLFDRIGIGRNVDGEFRALDDRGLGNLPPARKFADYRIEIDRTDLPSGVEILDLV